jgi:probable F420-dependent oxidoreductase
MSPVKVGVMFPIGNVNSHPAFVQAAGPAVEERGFESFWVPEHVVLFDDYDSPYPYADSGKFPGAGDSGILEPLTVLAAIAATTSTIRLGTGICLVSQRNPVYTAKQVADVDAMSGGRVDFGVGIGWLREEFEALNVPFEHRGRRADEHLQVMVKLWTEEVSSFEGDFYSLRPCRMYPKPAQQPHPPIHVGGESDAAMRRVAKYGQGWFGFNRSPEEVKPGLDALDRALAAEGRDRSSCEITICPYLRAIGPAEIAEYEAAGVDRLILVTFALEPDQLRRHLDDLVKTAGLDR